MLKPSFPTQAASRFERGMSVIELAISIIVLGIVFALALKGAALVGAMRAFMTQYQLEHLQNRILTYQMEYGALPGDDAQAGRRWDLPDPLARAGDIIGNAAGDGRLDGLLFDAFLPTGEQFMAWSHLRAARMVDGDPALSGLSSMPEHAFGGVIGLDRGNLGQSDGSLCATRIPGAWAERIDRSLDDGVINKGRVVATARYSIDALNHFDAPDSEPYNLEKEYIICLPMLP